MKQPTLTTARLTLRPFAAADARDVQRLAGAREVADTTLNIPHPYLDGMAEAWIGMHAAAWERGELATFAVTEASLGLVGAVSLRIVRKHRRAELGYWIAVPYWGRGYATEAAAATIAFGFEQLDLNRIHASHLTRNPASGRVMVKAGMRLEGCHRAHFIKWDRFEDLAVYGMLRDEWRANA